ncbi:MAG: efflux RND transporter periplasmic adaptor subunit [Candidatus Binatia bacterium]|nr:efflux RND transporter periplasmic adaptor subunit [Candidatus Binatia bacterium]MDG2011332.1 efflux RND transporter periplasmic adaptor subunit [Candidatus Binatia bacterium]HAC81450.1 efflux RND transporter periplasmic adaptor subunit [Deltaproteobacteria bacterium]
MSKQSKLYLGIVLVLLLIAGGFVYTTADPIPVELQTVESGVVESTVANTRAGTVEACRRARMAPIIGGQVARLPVDEGARVAEGDVILELWNQDLRAQVRLSEGQARASNARVEEACVMARVAAKEADRLASLEGQGIVSEEQTERGVGQAEAQQAGCRAAETQAEVAQAQVEAAKAALERTIMRAPFAGVVAEINGELGEVVTPSPVGVATLPTVDLIDAGCLYVHAPIDEVDAGQVREGMPVRLTLDAFPDAPLEGRVRRVAPYVLDLEKQARTVAVEVDFVDPEAIDALLPGYSADVEIVIAREANRLRIPTEAILEGKRVLKYTPEGLVEELEIQTGISNWRFSEVREGLSSGDQVILSIDREGVEGGASVTPETEEAS